MISTKKIVLGLLVSSLSFQAFPMEQAAPAPTKKQNIRIQTINFIQDKLEHIKNCLQGKETCSKTDFAIMAGSLLFLRSLFYGFFQQFEPREVFPSPDYQRGYGWRKGHFIPGGAVTAPARWVDPGTWGHKAGSRLGRPIRRAKEAVEALVK